MLLRAQVLICDGTEKTLRKTNEVRLQFEGEIARLGLKKEVQLLQVKKLKIADRGPVVIIYPGQVVYTKVKPDDVKTICEKHLLGGEIVEALVDKKLTEEEIDEINPFGLPGIYNKQLRLALRNCGVISPFDINEYIARYGYQALAKVLTEYTPKQVIDEISRSGLRGRGGGGYSTGRKWELCAINESDIKYVICNADEGDPGAFMDRSVIEGDPHSVIEAMTIAGYAIGAQQGYVYVRAEYPLAVKRLLYALDQAREYGLLGKNLFGTDFSFDIDVRLGAGAFVCGEETALIASIEGERGMPRNKPPFPAEKGLWQKPSIINNVETFANVPLIILNGFEWFSSIGTEKSKGTKVFALGGKVKNTGLVEIPMGTTLREVIYDIGGGIPNGKAFKAVQTGGPSGGCLTEKNLDTEIDYNNLIALGSMMGSGGMVVMDEDNCMVDVARFFLDFTVDESCGKCTPCREGTRRLLELLKKITSGQGSLADVDELERIALIVKNTSLCGLGQSAPNPVLSTLANFRHEYVAHVVDKKCPAHVCRDLLTFEITDQCRGCGLCKRKCPADAIKGNPKEKHQIDLSRCIKCGTCRAACAFNAIIVK